jgi:hypothetical protein
MKVSYNLHQYDTDSIVSSAQDVSLGFVDKGRLPRFLFLCGQRNASSRLRVNHYVWPLAGRSSENISSRDEDNSPSKGSSVAKG